MFANYIVTEEVTVDTADHQDHTFCGVAFDVKATSALPVEYLEIRSVAVRGQLGPMTVWTTPDTHKGKLARKSQWEKVYEGEHAESFRRFVALELTTPIRLSAGQTCGLFVHSATPGDTGVVYDNMRYRTSSEDPRALFSILPGSAALDCRPFGASGMWGMGWRDRREFVGRINSGVCWRLWNPEAECHQKFPACFRDVVRCMLLCARRPESPLHYLSDMIIFYILNMCRYDWFGDEGTDVQDVPDAEDTQVSRPQFRGRPPFGLRAVNRFRPFGRARLPSSPSSSSSSSSGAPEAELSDS